MIALDCNHCPWSTRHGELAFDRFPGHEAPNSAGGIQRSSYPPVRLEGWSCAVLLRYDHHFCWSRGTRRRHPVAALQGFTPAAQERRHQRGNHSNLFGLYRPIAGRCAHFDSWLIAPIDQYGYHQLVAGALVFGGLGGCLFPQAALFLFNLSLNERKFLNTL